MQRNSEKNIKYDFILDPETLKEYQRRLKVIGKSIRCSSSSDEFRIDEEKIDKEKFKEFMNRIEDKDIKDETEFLKKLLLVTGPFPKLYNKIKRHLCANITDNNALDMWKFGSDNNIPTLVDAAKNRYSQNDKLEFMPDFYKNCNADDCKKISDILIKRGQGDKCFDIIMQWGNSTTRNEENLKIFTEFPFDKLSDECFKKNIVPNIFFREEAISKQINESVKDHLAHEFNNFFLPCKCESVCNDILQRKVHLFVWKNQKFIVGEWGEKNNNEKFDEHIILSKIEDYGIVLYKDDIYVSGGVDENMNVLSSMKRYSLSERQWKNAASMYVARKGHILVEYKEHIYAIGGCSNARPAINIVERYDPAKNVWCFVASTNFIYELSPSLDAHAFNDYLYVIDRMHFTAYHPDLNWQKFESIEVPKFPEGQSIILKNDEDHLVVETVEISTGKRRIILQEYEPESKQWKCLYDDVCICLER